jgi:hypothetical protein
MKSDYFLNVELISKRKLSHKDLEGFKNSMELNDEFLNFCILFSRHSEINFSSHLEVYIEDQPFETDLLLEVESIINSIEDFVAGGWDEDSKIEWVTELHPSMTYVWFKEGNTWKSLIRNNERIFLGERDEWDDDYPTYDDRDFMDDY